jgi:quinoprotein glucose dehydrogenase
MSREFFESPAGVPCIAPPWGELVAIHADTGDVAWRVPLGDLRDKLGATSMATSLAPPNLGGPATTDTGLVFIGAAIDDYLRAFDTRDGRQRVAIMAGGHDTALSRIDNKLVVFALSRT